MPNKFNTFSLLLVGIGLYSCTTDTAVKNDCTVCPIQAYVSESGGNKGDGSSQSFSTGGELGVAIPKLKKMLKADLQLDTRYSTSQKSIDSTYWHFVSQHPELDQYANLYRSAHCALIQIICEDTTLEPAEKGTLNRKSAQAFLEKVDNIVASSMKVSLLSNPGEGSRPQENSPPVSPGVTPEGSNFLAAPPRAANPPAPVLKELIYLANTSSAQLALLNDDATQRPDPASLFAKYFRGNNYSTNNQLFRPAFLGKYRSRLRTGDPAPLTDAGAGASANCVCYFRQRSETEEVELLGRKALKLMVSGDLTLFDLRSGQVSTRSYSVTGSGMNSARALENTAKKMLYQFSEWQNLLSVCR